MPELKPSARKPKTKTNAPRAGKPAPARKSAPKPAPKAKGRAAPARKPAPTRAAPRAASSAKTGATTHVAPKEAAPRPTPATEKPTPVKTIAPRPASLRTPSLKIAPAAAAAPSAASSAAAAEAKERGGKKPKPPAKTMKVPAPTTDFLVKQNLPDIRRIASAALLSESARGITPPSPGSKTKEPERSDEPPVDANLIASSLATDVHPKIEDNYDYTVLEELVGSPHCPSPTRMVSTGCGGGEAAVFFAKRGFSVVGIDSDRTAVGLARERAWLAGVEIDFMVGGQFETPNLLPAESFGLAVDRGAFYRLTDDRDRQRYLANIRRLLVQGGLCYVSAGFFPLPEGYEKPSRAKKGPPKILLVREGGVVVSEVRQAGFDVVHRVLRPTTDSGEFGELLLYLRK